MKGDFLKWGEKFGLVEMEQDAHEVVAPQPHHFHTTPSTVLCFLILIPPHVLPVLHSEKYRSSLEIADLQDSMSLLVNPSLYLGGGWWSSPVQASLRLLEKWTTEGCSEIVGNLAFTVVFLVHYAETLWKSGVTRRWRDSWRGMRCIGHFFHDYCNTLSNLFIRCLYSFRTWY
jgi:hypothetical protein